MTRTMEWAARGDHMRGIPRKMVIMAVGAFAKAVANFLNTTTVHNGDQLINLVRSRPPGVPLITVSNHMSTLDDPVMWGFKGFPIFDSNLARWALAAEDICFKNPLLTYFFRTGNHFFLLIFVYCSQCPVFRTLVHYCQLHTFPEGKVSQEDAPIRRLKWGTASLIVRSPVTPIVLPIVHRGFEEVMPESFLFGRRPPFPLCNKSINIVIGEPMEFNLPKMTQMAISMSRNLHNPTRGWPILSPSGLDEAAQRCLYTSISEQIHTSMESLRSLSKKLSGAKSLNSGHVEE
ncbi:hypothetical protein SADUNF_Sadunf11G0108600 [Salix dunnii]|uniref:Tafazzin family protein n=1 Tax=Salix dunnii TaxID=1413687 RepID=A0A835JL92_9ROSI|nr:hypothetical protein SADUNF_Sadunf11G0108600 [Salix dunnii]